MSLALFKRPELWMDPLSSFDSLLKDPFVRYEDNGLALKSRVENNDTDYTITMEVPGFSEDEISIELKDNRLEITAEHSQSSDGKHFHRSIQRSWSLPKTIKEGEITAALKHGVLSVQVPKADPVQPKKIEVKALTS